MDIQTASTAVVSAWKFGAVFTTIITLLGAVGAVALQAFKAELKEVLQWDRAHWVQFNIFASMAVMFLIGVSGLLWMDMPTPA